MRQSIVSSHENIGVVVSSTHLSSRTSRRRTRERTVSTVDSKPASHTVTSTGESSGAGRVAKPSVHRTAESSGIAASARVRHIAPPRRRGRRDDATHLRHSPIPVSTTSSTAGIPASRTCDSAATRRVRACRTAQRITGRLGSRPSGRTTTHVHSLCRGFTAYHSRIPPST